MENNIGYPSVFLISSRGTMSGCLVRDNNREDYAYLISLPLPKDRWRRKIVLYMAKSKSQPNLVFIGVPLLPCGLGRPLQGYDIFIQISIPFVPVFVRQIWLTSSNIAIAILPVACQCLQRGSRQFCR